MLAWFHPLHCLLSISFHFSRLTASIDLCTLSIFGMTLKSYRAQTQKASVGIFKTYASCLPLQMASISLHIIFLGGLPFLLAAPNIQASNQVLFVWDKYKFDQEVETDVLPTFGMSIEGDIVVRTGRTPDLSFDAPLADPNRLWPGGVVHYKFYTTFPR